ncbi:MAG: hypothetical protein IPK64_18940 [bacterium]|nr:hypothetical protein [bacterium]
MKRELELHLAVCDACRLERAAFAVIADEIRRGMPRARRERTAGHPRRVARITSWGGTTMVACSLAVLLASPPRAAGGDRLLRSADPVRILRPVEGEIIAGTPCVRWVPIAGATGYRVRVESRGGDVTWSREILGRDSTLALEGASLPPGDYRAHVEPVPADLARPGGLAVAFRAGSPAEVACQRIARGPLAARWGLWAGVVAVAVAWWGGRGRSA